MKNALLKQANARAFFAVLFSELTKQEVQGYKYISYKINIFSSHFKNLSWHKIQCLLCFFNSIFLANTYNTKRKVLITKMLLVVKIHFLNPFPFPSLKKEIKTNIYPWEVLMLCDPLEKIIMLPMKNALVGWIPQKSTWQTRIKYHPIMYD